MNLYDVLFRQNGDPRDMGILKWRYPENPFTEFGNVLLAIDATATNNSTEKDAVAVDCAALCPTMGVPMLCEGKELRAAQAIDTLTDYRHRRMGLFQWLANENYKTSYEKGTQIIWGFPNVNAYPIYVKHLEWKMLDPVPFLIKPLRSGYFLKRIFPRFSSVTKWLDFPLSLIRKNNNDNISINVIETFDQEHDYLWKKYSKTLGVCVDRNSNYMNWRLVNRPNSEKYLKLGAWVDGKLAAEVVWTVEEKHGGRIGYILELMYDEKFFTAAETLIQDVISRMMEDNADAILAWSDPIFPNFPLFRKSGFLKIPEKLRPVELHWGVRILDNKIASFVSNRQNWYLSYLDSDTI